MAQRLSDVKLAEDKRGSLSLGGPFVQVLAVLFVGHAGELTGGRKERREVGNISTSQDGNKLERCLGAVGGNLRWTTQTEQLFLANITQTQYSH